MNPGKGEVMPKGKRGPRALLLGIILLGLLPLPGTAEGEPPVPVLPPGEADRPLAAGVAGDWFLLRPVTSVPRDLEPWRGWVLDRHPELSCVPAYADPVSRWCAFPQPLSLAVERKGGSFAQEWSVRSPAKILLPGAPGPTWPREVTVDGTPRAVTPMSGRPSVELGPGVHRVRGSFAWDALPASLAVPPATPALDLALLGKAVPAPRVSGGEVWLTAGEAGAEAGMEEDTARVRVFRMLADGQPQACESVWKIEVTGRRREVALEGLAPAGFTVDGITHSLPARLDPSGRLLVQVSRGSWEVRTSSHSYAGVTSLRVPAPPPAALAGVEALRPGEEVWSFAAANRFRFVEVTGGSPVDPRQTLMPEEWKSLPAYLVEPGQGLSLNVVRRGEGSANPDRVSVRREVWIDFAGKGLSIRDRLSGTIHQGWRMESQPPFELGRVVLNGEPQVITRAAREGKEPGAPGVEIREGNLDLVAEGWLPGRPTRLSAVGWDRDVESSSLTLAIPPGWDLFGVVGADKADETWLSRWDLLDLFLVLLVVLGIHSLLGLRPALVALVTLAMVWHEPGAPHFTWILLLAAVAAARALTGRRGERWGRWGVALSAVLLVLLLIPFAAREFRLALFPQLGWEGGGIQAGREVQADGMNMGGFEPEPAPEMRHGSNPRTEVLVRGVTSSMSNDAPPAPAPVYQGKRWKGWEEANLLTNTVTGTGPGMPSWRWGSVEVSWNGPVKRDQDLRLLLVPPLLVKAFRVLSVLLSLALALLLLAGDGSGRVLRRLPRLRAWKLAPLALAAGLLFPSPSPAAEFPDQTLLQELERRLTAPDPRFQSGTASIPLVLLRAEGDTLTIECELQADLEVAVPLPTLAPDWFSFTSFAGGGRADLARDGEGTVWARVPRGRTVFRLTGKVPPAQSLALRFPLLPHRVRVATRGWVVEGLAPDGRLAGEQLQLTRAAGADGKAAGAGVTEMGGLPPALVVERTLELGLEWSVTTRVTRRTGTGEGYSVRIPLLPGERVMSPLEVKDGMALVGFSPSAAQVEWESRLEISDRISLAASQTAPWAEIWKLDAAPLWHVETPPGAEGGLSPLSQQDTGGRWLPEWRPLPGERLELLVTRPQGVKGQVLTVDGGTLTAECGERSTSYSLEARLRSSQGGYFNLDLGGVPELSSVSLDGSELPIRLEGKGRLAFPVNPGSHTALVRWTEKKGIAAVERPPQIRLNASGVNWTTRTSLGEGRWILFTGGTLLGPAVLFWGLLAVVALAAFLLSRIPGSPYGWGSWALLGVGLTQAGMWGVLVVVWLLALEARRRPEAETARAGIFDLMQAGLVLLSLVALLVLYGAVENGLLGTPEMQVQGNGSWYGNLAWYQDRLPDGIPARPWALSVPILVYRLLMLAWALWLAVFMVKAVKRGWGSFHQGGAWKTVGWWNRKIVTEKEGK